MMSSQEMRHDAYQHLLDMADRFMAHARTATVDLHTRSTWNILSEKARLEGAYNIVRRLDPNGNGTEADLFSGLDKLVRLFSDEWNTGWTVDTMNDLRDAKMRLSILKEAWADARDQGDRV